MIGGMGFGQEGSAGGRRKVETEDKDVPLAPAEAPPPEPPARAFVLVHVDQSGERIVTTFPISRATQR